VAEDVAQHLPRRLGAGRPGQLLSQAAEPLHQLRPEEQRGLAPAGPEPVQPVAAVGAQLGVVGVAAGPGRGEGLHVFEQGRAGRLEIEPLAVRGPALVHLFTLASWMITG